MTISRRDFFVGLGGGAAGLGLAGLMQKQAVSAEAKSDTKQTSSTSYSYDNYRIYTQGREGNRHPNASPEYGMMSVVLGVDLKSGEVTSEMVPIHSAHHVLYAEPSDRIFVLSQKGPTSAVMTPDFKLDKILQAPEGHVFSGHGAVTPDQKHILLTYRDVSEDDHSRNQGVAGIYNAKTYKLEDKVNIGGVAPHDIAYLSDNNTVVVTCNGNLRYLPEDAEKPEGEEAYEDYGDEFGPDFFAPKIVMFDMTKFKPVDEIVSPVANPVVHLTVAANDKVYSVSNSYIPNTKGGIDAKALQNVAREYPDRKWPIHNLEYTEGVVRGLPIIEYDTKAKKTRTIFLGAENQRRSQSICYNAVGGDVFATFVFSNILLRINKEGKEEAFDSRKLGVTDPIGVCDIPGTPYIVLAGIYDDLSVVDTREMEVIQRLPGHLYRSSHLTPVKV